MPSTTARTLGSGYTVLYFGGPTDAFPIAFMQMFNETPPRLVAEARPIHPVDFEHPAEIMTAKAIGEGTIEVNLIESWSEQAWNRFGNAFPGLLGEARGGSACNNILDIVRAVDESEGEIFVSKLIATPNSTTESFQRHRRSVLYMGVKIVDIRDGDQNVSVDAMEQIVPVTFMYTHRLYNYTPQGSGYSPQAPNWNQRAIERPGLRL